MDGNFLKGLAIEMSTQMSHIVKKSTRKVMLLNGATSTRITHVGGKTRKFADKIVTNSDTRKYSVLTSFFMTRSVLLRMVSI